MLKRALLIIVVLIPQIATAADLGYPRQHRHYSERRAEPEYLLGPIVHCSRTHLFFATNYTCDTGLHDIDITDTSGW